MHQYNPLCGGHPDSVGMSLHIVHTAKVHTIPAERTPSSLLNACRKDTSLGEVLFGVLKPPLVETPVWTPRLLKPRGFQALRLDAVLRVLSQVRHSSWRTTNNNTALFIGLSDSSVLYSSETCTWPILIRNAQQKREILDKKRHKRCCNQCCWECSLLSATN